MAKEIKKMLMKVVRIRNINSEGISAKGDETEKETHPYSLVSKDGITKVKITSPVKWEGIHRKSVIDVIISNSQTALSEFEKEEETKSEAEKIVVPDEGGKDTKKRRENHA